MSKHRDFFRMSKYNFLKNQRPKSLGNGLSKIDRLERCELLKSPVNLRRIHLRQTAGIKGANLGVMADEAVVKITDPDKPKLHLIF